MTSEQHKKLARIVASKIEGKYSCPICKDKSREFKVGVPVEMREFNEGLSLGGAAIFPFVPVTCDLCSHTILLNGMSLGIIDVRGKYNF
jgi:hypothetical protein